MIDKLAIASSEMDLETLKQAFGETVTARPVNNQYMTCRSVTTLAGVHLFTAYSGPRNPNVKPYRLELNPAKLGLTFDQLMSTLGRGLDVTEATIQRLDHAADFNIPVSRAFETVRMKFKRRVKGYDVPRDRDWLNGELTGFAIGSRFVKMTIYNKSYEQAKRNKDLIFPIGNLTRFELKQTSKMVPTRTLAELPFLLDFNPYRNLEALDLRDDTEISDEFLKIKKSDGLQNAYIRLNKHGNARRDTRKYFSESDLPDKLAEIYRYNLGQFFSSSSRVDSNRLQLTEKLNAISIKDLR